jgi:GntR family transcriptional regulator
VYLPAQLVPGLIDRTEPIESLYQLLADTYGILPANALESYAPTRLASDQARLLETRPRALAFRAVRTTSDQRGRTTEFATSLLRADKYEVRLLLSRSPTRAGLASTFSGVRPANYPDVEAVQFSFSES